MLNAKKLLRMARKWQKAASLGRKRIVSARTNHDSDSDKCSASVASRGHLFVYTSDEKRFMIPLKYLNSSIFRELFRMSEEEFGLPSSGPITLPCNASCMEYIVSLVRCCQVSMDVERAVLNSIAGGRCLPSSLPLLGHSQQQLAIHGY